MASSQMMTDHSSKIVSFNEKLELNHNGARRQRINIDDVNTHTHRITTNREKKEEKKTKCYRTRTTTNNNEQRHNKFG